MVAQKTDRLDKYPAISLRLKRTDCFFDGGSEPWSAGHSLTLEGESPILAIDGRFCSNPRRRFLRLPFVRIAIGNGALRHAVSSKNDCDLLLGFPQSVCQANLQFFGVGFNQQRMIVPGFDEVKAERKVTAR